ncbi:condensation domain-containing protein [Brevibacillus dissolubilis]|uniref:condensation domain-containing protein n=1 Tax=Brevibacillus dissolubilis TaxID=1844116 RepID=UPI0011169935|nr:condensation domain-containing protein [Brevibacillus dissolubilis]
MMKNLVDRIEALSDEQLQLLTLVRAQKSMRNRGLDSIPVQGERTSFPLSFAQQRMWFLHQFISDKTVYNISAALSIKGELNIGLLEAAWKKLIARHEILRTTFHVTSGQMYQTVAAEIDFALQVEELQIEDEEELIQRVNHELKVTFDLERGPLIWVKLFQLGRQEYVLLVVVHHIIADGWSMGVLIRELSELYQENQFHQQGNLPPLRYQYGDFAAWQRSSGKEEESFLLQAEYWKRQLRDLQTVLELPTDHPRTNEQTYNGDRYQFEIPHHVTSKLEQISKEEHVSLFDVWFTLFHILLYRYSGQTDMMIGIPIANRNKLEIEGLAGCFVNTLPIRTKLDEGVSFRSLLKQIHTCVNQAYINQDYPYEQMVQQLNLDKHAEKSSVFQVMFSYQNMPMPKLNMTGLEIDYLDITNGTSKFDMTLFVIPADGSFTLSIEYNRDLFEKDTIIRMASHFKNLIDYITSHIEVGV